MKMMMIGFGVTLTLATVVAGCASEAEESEPKASENLPNAAAEPSLTTQAVMGPQQCEYFCTSGTPGYYRVQQCTAANYNACVAACGAGNCSHPNVTGR